MGTANVGFLGDLMRVAGIAAVALSVLLSAGCAPKVVAPPAEIVPPPVEPKPISISEVLLRQYGTWKGVAYRFGGAGKSGIDCSGLMRVVFMDGFGLALPRTSIEQSRLGQPVPRENIRAGDLLFFSDRRSDHIGVAMGDDRFLHASTSEGVTVSELGAYWLPRLSRVSRILEDARYTAEGAAQSETPFSAGVGALLALR